MKLDHFMSPWVRFLNLFPKTCFTERPFILFVLTYLIFAINAHFIDLLIPSSIHGQHFFIVSPCDFEILLVHCL